MDEFRRQAQNKEHRSPAIIAAALLGRDDGAVILVHKSAFPLVSLHALLFSQEGFSSP